MLNGMFVLKRDELAINHQHTYAINMQDRNPGTFYRQKLDWNKTIFTQSGAAFLSVNAIIPTTDREPSTHSGFTIYFNSIYFKVHSIH